MFTLEEMQLSVFMRYS